MHCEHYIVWILLSVEIVIDKIYAQSIYNACAQPADAERATEVARRKFDEMFKAATQSNNAIFVNHLPNYWLDYHVRKLLEAFGPLRTLVAPKDSNYLPMGFAVCEFADPSVTDMAVMGLNGIQVGDRSLSAERIPPRFVPSFSGQIAQIPNQPVPLNRAWYIEVSRTINDILRREAYFSDWTAVTGFFPKNWNDSQIQELLEAFGPLRKLILPKDSTGASMGIAVYEYIDTNTTYWGLPELNGLPLGEKVLAAWRVTYSRAASNAPVAAKFVEEIRNGRTKLSRVLAKYNLGYPAALEPMTPTMDPYGLYNVIYRCC